jgi:hypothetical protein
MWRKRNIPICRHARLQRLFLRYEQVRLHRHTVTFSLTVTISVTRVNRVSFVTLISIDVFLPVWQSVQLLRRGSCVIVPAATQNYSFVYVSIRTQMWITYLLHYFVMAQSTMELCVYVCVCVCMCHCAWLWLSALTSTFIIRFLVLFSDLLLISHKGFSDWLVN